MPNKEDCEKCPSKEPCKKMGKEKFLALVGQCKNCKATVRVGSFKDRDKNRAHKQTIYCVSTDWAEKPMMEAVFPRGRCPICQSFPIRVMKWREKDDRSTQERTRSGDGHSAFSGQRDKG